MFASHYHSPLATVLMKEKKMNPGIFVPLGCFTMVVLIVAIVSLSKLRDREIQTHRYLHEQEMEHQGKMKELEMQLEQVKSSG
jgi:hypothetical protein